MYLFIIDAFGIKKIEEMEKLRWRNIKKIKSLGRNL